MTGYAKSLDAGSPLHEAILAATGAAAAGTPAAAARTVQALASTGTQTSVAASASDGVILVANSNRLGFDVFNDSTATLSLLFASGTSSSSNKSVDVGPGGFYENRIYAGVVKGLWSAANGNARVTEYT